jgi:hypothetical protein
MGGTRGQWQSIDCPRRSPYGRRGHCRVRPTTANEDTTSAQRNGQYECGHDGIIKARFAHEKIIVYLYEPVGDGDGHGHNDNTNKATARR